MAKGLSVGGPVSIPTPQARRRWVKGRATTPSTTFLITTIGREISHCVSSWLSHHTIPNTFVGDSLSRKLLISKEERDVQIRAFNEVRDTIPPDAAAQWVGEVLAWEKERKLPVKDQRAPNPYEMLKNGEFTSFVLLVVSMFNTLCFLRWGDRGSGAPATP